MISRYEVALNGVSMAEISEKLLILDVEYEKPNISITNKEIAGRNGGIITKQYKDQASVMITFELRVYDIAERQAALQSIISWARNGGILTVNDRQGQQLNCICSKFPSIDSVKKWLNPLQITFTAYTNPYWEDSEPTAFTLSGKSASTNIEIPGNGGDAPVTCTIVPRTTLSEVTVTAGSTHIELSGLRILNGKSVSIAHDGGIIHIYTDSTSLLNRRSPLSSDRLVVPSGVSSVFSFRADASSQVTFWVRGCWQ